MISLDKYAKKYGDIPYPENISEKQAKKYVETYVKLGRSRGRAKGEVLKKYKKTISRLRKSGYVVPENIKLPAKYDTSYIYAQSFKPNPQTGDVYPGLYARGKSFGVKTKPSTPTPPNIMGKFYVIDFNNGAMRCAKFKNYAECLKHAESVNAEHGFTIYEYESEEEYFNPNYEDGE